MDPTLEPILAKAIVKVAGNRWVLRVGDKDIDWNPEFRLYMTTKLANPHYAPEVGHVQQLFFFFGDLLNMCPHSSRSLCKQVCTKTTIVNFAVKEQGLEDQLLGIVVRKERIDLERSKNELVVQMADAKV